MYNFKQLKTMFKNVSSKSIKRMKPFLWSCGIVAYIGNEPARDYLLEGIQILRNRGYDSAGISTISQDKIETSKFASVNTSDSFEILEKASLGKHKGHIGIAHTRWATHGAKTDVNAHPHNDSSSRISLVHNGTIENWYELKTTLEKNGAIFRSETDSEVIVQLISSLYDPKKKNILSAVITAISQLKGTYGLAVICSDFPDRILAVRHGSPLVVGISPSKRWVASEYGAFSRHTKNYLELRDDEISVIKTNDLSIDYEGRLKTAPPEEIAVSPHPYDHWTIKEIMEQPAAVNSALNNGGRINGGSVVLGGLDAHKVYLSQVKNLVICACGTSFYASLYVSKLMRRLKCLENVHVVNASEFDINYFSKPRESAMLVVSQSGETADVIRAIKCAEENNIFIFSVVNAVASQIAHLSKCGVYVNAGREFGVASTKAFTSQVVVLTLIALWFSVKCKEGENDSLGTGLIKSLQRLSYCMRPALHLKNQCERIAETVKDSQSLFVLGKGCAEAIAKEAALKIKEMSYIHAEGFSGGELKHGPFALIEEGTPIFAVLLDDKHARLMKISCEEVLARGAKLFVVTDNAKLVQNIDCEVLRIPSNGDLTALLSIIPLQLIAYYLALKRGLNPDKPRNLAKSVTVD